MKLPALAHLREGFKECSHAHGSTCYGEAQFSRSVVSDSLRPRGLQHVRLACPSPTQSLLKTPVYQVGDAIQPSHPLSSPYPPAFSLSQHQFLF